jgi:predicted site-specific integrase-resolvase
MKSFLSAAEVGRILKRDRATILRWLRKGIIKNAYKPEGKRDWRIPLSEYEELVRKNENNQL